MVHIRTRRSSEQQVLLAACTTSVAAVRTAPIATTRRPAVRPLPGIAAQVLADLRADDARDSSAAAIRALLAVPMHDPAEDPQPIAELLARAEHVRRSRNLACDALFAEDKARREQAAYDAWASDTDAELLAECCADITAALNARPELRHDHGLLMALVPVVAMLKEVA